IAGSALAAAMTALAIPAAAGPCYVVLDKAQNVIYQSPQPPVDLSVQGHAARDAMRRRGEFMEMFDSQACVERSGRSVSGKGEASVDEIVAGIKSYQRVGRVGAMSTPDDDAGRFVDPSAGSASAPLSY
ncbi:MAG: hypothetical protein ABI190_02320, partial [Casimicrobiaceae bacterium]